MAAEIAGVCVFTSILDLALLKRQSAHQWNPEHMTESSMCMLVVQASQYDVACVRWTNVFMTSSHNFCVHHYVPPAPFPVHGTQRRDSSKLCSMFWVMESEIVIDGRSNEPVLMTAGTWKDRKDSMEFSAGRTWHYHGMVDKSHILLRDDCNGQGRRIE